MTRLTIAATCMLLAGMLVMDPVAAAPPALIRTDLQRHDLSIQGHEAIQVRVDFPSGAVAAPHTHPGEEIIYVLQGTLEYVVAGKPVTLNTGGVLFIPPGTVHSAINTGTGTASELATYVVEKGKPLVVPAP